MSEDQARATVRIDKEEWEKFQRICKNLGSNASVEIRRFIKSFNREKESWSKED